MSTIYIPAQSAEDWRLFLAEPDKQWKTGYAAKTLAYCCTEVSLPSFWRGNFRLG
jgi:hypothetical protein